MSDTKTAQDYLTAGVAALKRAAWAEAKAAFEHVLEMSEMPEAHDGLGIALWWLNEIEAAHHQRTLAYMGFKRSGSVGQAALIACWLAREQLFLSANVPAMQGWFARAEQLLVLLPASLEQAWFVILRASVVSPPHELVDIAAQTTAAAQQFKNSNLEAFGLALHGQGLVTLGQVGEGMARLDEAMTMATGGEVTEFTIISEIFCFMLSTCEIAGDVTRSDLWCRRAAAFAEQYSCFFLSAYCRTAYGGLMTALGRWQDAETALIDAIHAFERGHKGLRIHAIIKLADLRVSQGKFEEAEVMLQGMEDHSVAVVPLARLWLQKGKTALAKAMLELAVPDSASFTLHHLPALLLLVEVLLRLGDYAGVQRLVAHLVAMAAQAQSPLFTAQIEFIKGRVSLHRGDFGAAKVSFNRALDHLQFYEQSLLAGQVRLRMAQTLQIDDPAGAIAWAKGALATFERVGAEQEMAEAAQLLRELGIGRGALPRTPNILTRRELEIVGLITQGLTNRDIAARLVISPKTVEHHVSHVLEKLNLRSRAEIAAFSASGKLSTSLEEN